MKCKTCGFEYEGVFCPECGSRNEDSISPEEKELLEAKKKQEEEDRRAREKAEQDKIAKERAEKEAELAKIKIEQDRIEKENAEKKRAEAEVKKAENEGKTMAILSMICGIIGLCSCGLFVIPDILGIIFAFCGKKKGKMRGLAKAGLICSVISIVMMIVVLIFAFLMPETTTSESVSETVSETVSESVSESIVETSESKIDASGESNSASLEEQIQVTADKLKDGYYVSENDSMYAIRINNDENSAEFLYVSDGVADVMFMGDIEETDSGIYHFESADGRAESDLKFENDVIFIMMDGEPGEQYAYASDFSVAGGGGENNFPNEELVAQSEYQQVEDTNSDDGIRRGPYGDYTETDYSFSSGGFTIYTPDSFPYEDKRAQKLCELYKKALADQDNWVKVDVKGYDYSGFTYTRSLYGDMYYYGDLKGSNPNGNGIIFELGGEGAYIPTYMGGFSKGLYSGYGIEIVRKQVNGWPYLPEVSYEGEFKKGLHEGAGVEYYGFEEAYIWDIAKQVFRSEPHDFGSYASDYASDQMRENGKVFVGACFATYKGGFKKGERSGTGTEYTLDTLTLDSRVVYTGKWANGQYSGKGKLYYDNGQVAYDGEFKRGYYDGKGTLYDQNGNVEYKGKFKDGEIK